MSSIFTCFAFCGQLVWASRVDGLNGVVYLVVLMFDLAISLTVLHRWVVFLSGLAHLTLPNSTTEAWVEGGKNGAILALDTADVSALGHYTTYPSQEQTTALQIPLGERGVPGHRVLHEGPCQGEELIA